MFWLFKDLFGSMSSIEDQFNKCNATITLFKIQLNDLQKSLQLIKQQTKKEIKQIEKNEAQKYKELQMQAKERKKRVVHSGIAKPLQLGKELCIFLNVEPNTCMSRTEVTKLLFAYIKTNSLYSKEHKRIIPDKKLKQLMGDFDDDAIILTHFTIQKIMNKHYIV